MRDRVEAREVDCCPVLLERVGMTHARRLGWSCFRLRSIVRLVFRGPSEITSIARAGYLTLLTLRTSGSGFITFEVLSSLAIFLLGGIIDSVYLLFTAFATSWKC